VRGGALGLDGTLFVFRLFCRVGTPGSAALARLGRA